MTVVPPPTMVTLPAEVIVATPGTLLVYVNAPTKLFDEGSLILKEASFKFLDVMLYAWKVGSIGLTTKDASTNFVL